MGILYTAEQRAQRNAVKQMERRARREAQKGRPKLDKGPDRDRDYMAWLHEGLPCIACLKWGRPKNAGFNPIEAAHIWLAEGAMKGVRNSDWTCVPICKFHHQLDRDACDVNQRKFFDRLGVDAIAFCQALYQAFLTGRDGFWIIHEFAGKGALETQASDGAALPSCTATTPDEGLKTNPENGSVSRRRRW